MLLCECGAGSFKHVVDDDDLDDVGCAGGGPPPKGRRRRRRSGAKPQANPYADRGLDRFSVVLSELETRRAKILRGVAGGSRILVRFVQCNGDWAPVVVRLPDENLIKGAAARKPPSRAASALPTRRQAAPAYSPTPPDPASPREGDSGARRATTKAMVPARGRPSSPWARTTRRPSCYLPAAVVMTLVSLAVFGRVFAIWLASVWWYLLPTLGGGRSDELGDGVRASGMRKKSMERNKLGSPPPRAK